MSRFFQALKEASRSAPELNGLPQQGDLASPPTLPAGIAEQMAGEFAATVPGGAFDSMLGTEAHELGTVTHVSLDQAARLIPHVIDPSIMESYRRLRTKILQEQQANPFRSLLVASPYSQEGKSVTVLNLGFSFAMLPEFRVLVVDGDLRKGSLGKWLGVADGPGLGNLVEGSATLEDVVWKSDASPLHFMLCGNSKVPSAELLHSPQLSTHFRHMAEKFDLILVDSPPVNVLTDTQQLAASCDAVLLVVRAFATNRKALEKAVQELAPFRIVGAVLNAGIRTRRRESYYGYYAAERARR